MGTITTEGVTGPGAQPLVQLLPRTGRNAPRHSSSSQFTLPPIETNGASTPREFSPMVPTNDHDDDKVSICSDGDLVLNVYVRRFGLATSPREQFQGPRLGDRDKLFTEVKLLGQFRVSSVVLRMASHSLKNCLDSGMGSLIPFRTGLPLLLLHKDDNQTLNLVMERTLRTSSSFLAEREALAILLKILHLTLDPIYTFSHDARVMTALVAEFACALGCEGPVVPWINLWLTRYLPQIGISDRSWYRSTEGHYVGIILSYTMGDGIAFGRWSKLCIRYGHDSDNFAGPGCVWSVINSKLPYQNAVPNRCSSLA